MGKLRAFLTFLAFPGFAIICLADDDAAPPAYQLVISVAEQKLAVVKDGGLVRKYPVSTSKFGLGDRLNSYCTPLGHLRVCDKIGDDLPVGSVLKRRSATGEVLPANAPGRDPIVTRIMWLEGLDSCNTNAKSRGIYIHGTVEENKLGQPVSYGCIRMRSRDVVELFAETPVGTAVEIISDHFPQFRKVAPKTETLFASNDAPTTTTTTTTTMGPRGTLIFRTIHTAAPAKAGPTQVAAIAPIATATPATKAPDAAAKPAEPSAKLVAKNSPTPPVADTPTIVFATSRAVSKIAPSETEAANEPRVEFRMTGSILTANLSAKSKAAPVPAAVAPAAPVAVPQSPRVIALDVSSISLVLLDGRSNQHDTFDALTQYLLDPPQPQLNLAFRTVIPRSKL